MLMRWPQRVQTSGSTWYSLAIRRAQLGEQRLRGGSAATGLFRPREADCSPRTRVAYSFFASDQKIPRDAACARFQTVPQVSLFSLRLTPSWSESAIG